MKLPIVADAEAIGVDAEALARAAEHRRRETRRTALRDDLPLQLFVWLHGQRVPCVVQDLGFGGLSFVAAAVGGRSPRFRRTEVLRLELEFAVDVLAEERRPGREQRTLSIAGEVTYFDGERTGVRIAPLSASQAAGRGGGFACGARSEGSERSRGPDLLRPEPGDVGALEVWRGLVAAHLFPSTTIAPAWTEELLRVLREKYLAHWAKDERVDAIVRDFPEVARILRANDLGHNVLYHREERGLATISFIKLFPESLVGHQIAIARHLPMETWHEGLRQAYAHGFELPTADAPSEHIIAGYCTGERQWLQRIHLGYARKDPASCHALPIQLYRVEVEPNEAPPLATVHKATEREVERLFRTLAGSTTSLARHSFYRKSLALMAPLYQEHLRACREDVGMRELRVGRRAFSVRGADGQAIAVATVDTARIGTNVLGLFDHCHVYDLRVVPEDDEAGQLEQERARIALLQAARASYAELGRPWFHWSVERPELIDAPELMNDPHIAALKAEAQALTDRWAPHLTLRPVGPGFYFALRTRAVQDFLQHLFDETADPSTWA